ncbi:MAG: SMP-30/gluconolactonase/LRE family protein [Planctomycetes bacterium]|nr:SMP-30/gluconolactonase/LRE family protein [Planctomycetota bacterium]
MNMLQSLFLKHRTWLLVAVVAAVFGWPVEAEQQADPPRWLLGKAYHIPSEFTNQESGYFSIIEGKNGRLYIGTAKYGVNAYLVEFNPVNGVMQMVVDVHRAIMSMLRGFGAQAKIHTRNNVGQLTGKIYFGSKQGYPEKGEKLTDYPGGYVLTYDPKTGKTENLGMPLKQAGVISVTPDEERGLCYISTCDDGRPIEKSHFMILDLKTKKYRDLGDTGISYAFIVVDHQGRAYHPVRNGKIARYDPKSDKLDILDITVDGQPPPLALTKDGTEKGAGHGAVLNWDWSPDRKTLWCVEMSTNQLFSFDLAATSAKIPGKTHGPLMASVKATDCRAMCVDNKGKVWMALSHSVSGIGPRAHLVSYTPGAKAPRDHGPIGVANPDYITLKDEKGKPRPWHHTLRKEKDGTYTPWQPLGIAAGADGSVNVLTLAPFTLFRFAPEQLK